MSNYIPGNQKHLTLNDRKYIERALNDGQTYKDIARYLCKDPTTISKEVKKQLIIARLLINIVTTQSMPNGNTVRSLNLLGPV